MQAKAGSCHDIPESSGTDAAFLRFVVDAVGEHRACRGLSILENELERFSPELAAKPRLMIVTKMDMSMTRRKLPWMHLC